MSKLRKLKQDEMTGRERTNSNAAKQTEESQTVKTPKTPKPLDRSVYEAHIMQFMHEEAQRKKHDYGPCNR